MNVNDMMNPADCNGKCDTSTELYLERESYVLDSSGKVLGVYSTPIDALFARDHHEGLSGQDLLVHFSPIAK